jgi:xanthine dehydrogenase accessory factor
MSGSRSVGAKMLVFLDGSQHGALGLGELDARIAQDAREALRSAHSLQRSYYLEECDGDVVAGDESAVQVFVESHVPPPTLLIVGAGHTSIALASIAKLIGFSVVLIDARAALATSARFPQADEVVVEWPHVALARKQITSNTYVAVLTHDPKFEEPLLPLLLRSAAPYIGVIGSKRTQALRLRRLRDQGFGDEDLQRVHGPVGLDIGAVTPEEIALSVMAEIVANQHHRLGSPLRDAFAARQLSSVQ